MKKEVLFAVFLFAAVLITSCSTQQQTVCNKPYIQVGTDCCLDKNDNSICDEDEIEESIEEDGVTVNCIKLCDPGVTRCSLEYKEQCSDNGCSWMELGKSDECVVPCIYNLDCHDNNKCTKDTCKYGKCKNRVTLWCKLFGD